ncbi:MAG: hypothetical protein A2487_15215 [Candidatus Raymondbacteria bacterium RifOxyC12_full_50_8]|uniref:FlgD/Vpr Ig-like domain-containing protein n=1 Tax=Candidatus Raymondbacteria bacterium RIFOXYD12_FULL_49_13 TaxID=1817890 RepID=A0A1F7FK95_UNCRA|nr:MAG: hypothetical protein A2350_10605 [Candidatus Raymondbacteria bacterium RifOxyB12_full_50_8]OGJ91987.1 MAG: hypothetical protein A2248_09435 [Candidatus Raymondbacteria bacterium RIFOXYA2_FULL_49_16]OGJ96345.1 MAG: hypothetical protein A2453_08455 [Candidatus Raymondbacteria bacterium RIFOXYC2_FULL_50_21]OGK03720.1 MAG: hypothetical protein A2487_15215 [Candidatus Raymondbacteria bacterium RifOxyC12_full_50_8]OGK06882.1 MAG: hypothetical protein A2519_11525 [Candidatus Raymondbacteria ba
MNNKIVIIQVIALYASLFSYITFDGKEVPPFAPPPANAVNVSTLSQFSAALNTQTAGQTIVLADGVYSVANIEPLSIRVNNLTIRGASGDPSKVIISGKGFENCAYPDEEMFMFNNHASNVTFADFTISESRCHGIKLQSNANNNCLIHNMRFINIGERMIKSPGIAIGNVNVSLSWEIRYSHFENTKVPLNDSCRNDHDGGNYIAGMDLMSCEDWNIHDNVFMNIKGASGMARGAVFPWAGTQTGGGTWVGCKNMTTQRNTFVGCDQSICYWGTVTGGLIKNNIILPGNIGIKINNSVNIKVYNNTSFSANSASSGAFSFSQSTGCELKNNIIYGGMTAVGTSLDTAKNMMIGRSLRLIAAQWFGDEASADLHLKSDTCGPVDAGVSLPEVTDDWDGLSRDAMPDIGADELSNNTNITMLECSQSNTLYLSNAGPNPCNPVTAFRYGIPARYAGLPFSIVVLSPKGDAVKTIKSGVAFPGNYMVRWDGKDDSGRPASSGIYVIHLATGTASRTVKVALMK